MTHPVTAVSYLLGCAGHGVAAVVDPVLPPDDYRHAAELLGVRLAFVIDTHVHADHLSTGPDLATATGATYVLHASAGALLAFDARARRARLDLGNVQLVVIHTPGHTPEAPVIARDRPYTRGPEPWALLTGHTLDGRRPRTHGARQRARVLARRPCLPRPTRLRQLPDYVEVWPGAFVGSVCGRGLSGKPSSTIGFERRFNRVFAIEDEGAFVEAHAGTHPAATSRR